MPITLTTVYITTPDKRAVLQIAGAEYVIPPENAYHIDWPTVIADDTMTRLVKGAWEFSLVIDVDFIDAFGESKHSMFCVSCKCGPTSCEVNEYGNRQPV
jgi:hypothetical protein